MAAAGGGSARCGAGCPEGGRGSTTGSGLAVMFGESGYLSLVHT